MLFSALAFLLTLVLVYYEVNDGCRENFCKLSLFQLLRGKYKRARKVVRPLILTRLILSSLIINAILIGVLPVVLLSLLREKDVTVPVMDQAVQATSLLLFGLGLVMAAKGSLTYNYRLKRKRVKEELAKAIAGQQVADRDSLISKAVRRSVPKIVGLIRPVRGVVELVYQREFVRPFESCREHVISGIVKDFGDHFSADQILHAFNQARYQLSLDNLFYGTNQNRIYEVLDLMLAIENYSAATLERLIEQANAKEQRDEVRYRVRRTASLRIGSDEVTADICDESIHGAHVTISGWVDAGDIVLFDFGQASCEGIVRYAQRINGRLPNLCEVGLRFDGGIPDDCQTFGQSQA